MYEGILFVNCYDVAKCWSKKVYAGGGGDIHLKMGYGYIPPLRPPFSGPPGYSLRPPFHNFSVPQHHTFV